MGAAAVVAVVGREEELRVARAAFDEPGSAGVVFRGEPGIGKTTLWEATASATAASGRRLLIAHPAEAERELALTTFADLVQPLADEVLPWLPAPQRAAVEAALLLGEARTGRVSPRTLGTALLETLRVAGEDGGAVLAIDDFQWTDAASRAAVEFALRRLSIAGASALLTLRAGDAARGVPAFDPAARVATIDVGPLSLDALHRLVCDRCGESLPRPVLRRVHTVSGGNPFYALEIARALRGRPAAVDDELPVPADLEALPRERIAGLPPATRRALAAAAALAEPRVELVEDEGDLGPALAAGVVRVERGVVRFVHPLLASAASSLLAPRRRRELHERLAAAVADGEQRARHLAAAHPGPDEVVALALEGAAERAGARGAPAAAGELLELAVQRTADAGCLPTRRLAAARAYIAAGEMSTARPLVEHAIADLSPGSERARALTMLASLQRDDLPAACALAEQAWLEAVGDRAAEAVAARLLSSLLLLSGDLRARKFARAALDRADALPDVLRVAASGSAALIDIWTTGRTDSQLLAVAVELEERTGVASDTGGPRLALATQLCLEERLADARAVLERLVADLEAVREEFRLQEALNHLAFVETRAGRLRVAAAHAARGAELREQSGMPHGRALLAFFAAEPAALLGQVEEAQALAERGVAAAAAAGDLAATLQNTSVLGFVQLSLGDPEGAARTLAPVAARIAADAPGLDPAHVPVLPNLIEALIALGNDAEARHQLEVLEERGRRLDSAWSLSQASRARGLLAARSGDLDGALTAFDDALREHERMEGPFERGRTLLARGSVLRRARRWGAARESLVAARAIFDAIEAPLWAEKASAELSRVGGRRVSAGLTPAEEQVARLVADGRSNKQVASELFVTVRTVETHLTRIYDKLDVRSRRELAGRLSS